ncbi:glutaredoxin 3 [uncultured Neptuniibacter sp.]|uniref:glutaredoxin 3 n=1 Tax=uncultured Neptuniibacter sp. TaxID=502143 RepID=UPI00261F9E4C|nr:glutaredoxin 3 [uncultured Neptuniibacter sp.]
MDKIEIYTKSYCPYCQAAKKLLTHLGWQYREYEITGKQQQQREMVQRAQRKTVPQIFINDQHIGGFDDFSSMLRDSGQI